MSGRQIPRKALFSPMRRVFNRAYLAARYAYLLEIFNSIFLKTKSKLFSCYSPHIRPIILLIEATCFLTNKLIKEYDHEKHQIFCNCFHSVPGFFR